MSTTNGQRRLWGQRGGAINGGTTKPVAARFIRTIAGGKMAVHFTERLRTEYQRLFDGCIIRLQRQPLVESILKKIDQYQYRYSTVGESLGIPWYLIGVIHCMESSLNFKTHLHNGDPLTKRTSSVPKNRPKQAEPPFTWEISAADALQMRRLHVVKEWTIPRMLYELERYNGFGYRKFHPEILSPYLWSFSNHYTRGKYRSDGIFSPRASSKQCGGAVLLRRMAESGTIQLDQNGLIVPGKSAVPVEKLDPMVRFSATRKSEAAENLQRMLNTFPGIFLKVDGIPGPRTSNAFKKVTGHFLLGDPRE